MAGKFPDRFQRAKENEEFWYEQLQEDFKDDREIMTPFGPIVNPWYDPQKDIILASVLPDSCEEILDDGSESGDKLLFAEASKTITEDSDESIP